jgi:6-pyruvoyltetrahydropterin/6-carboxytetrahydropterin synthase
MLTCSKLYADIPFAHRQHHHTGDCALIHGHNWSFRFTFGCTQPDENGFVVDFGKLKFIRRWLDEHLDHACVLNADDPALPALRENHGELFKFYLVESCSCEGLAAHVFHAVNPLVQAATSGRVFLLGVEVFEDGRNSANFVPGVVAPLRVEQDTAGSTAQFSRP